MGVEVKFGTEKTISVLDEQGSTLTVIKKWRKGEVTKSYKQFKERYKVSSQKEQMVEFMRHSEKILEKHKAGILVIKDEDPMLYPAFWTEYPKFDVDGSYFVVSQWTELV